MGTHRRAGRAATPENPMATVRLAVQAYKKVLEGSQGQYRVRFYFLVQQKIHVPGVGFYVGTRPVGTQEHDEWDPRPPLLYIFQAYSSKNNLPNDATINDAFDPCEVENGPDVLTPPGWHVQGYFAIGVGGQSHLKLYTGRGTALQFPVSNLPDNGDNGFIGLNFHGNWYRPINPFSD
jgi:hypothetical protein